MRLATGMMACTRVLRHMRRLRPILRPKTTSPGPEGQLLPNSTLFHRHSRSYHYRLEQSYQHTRSGEVHTPSLPLIRIRTPKPSTPVDFILPPFTDRTMTKGRTAPMGPRMRRMKLCFLSRSQTTRWERRVSAHTGHRICAPPCRLPIQVIHRTPRVDSRITSSRRCSQCLLANLTDRP